MHVIFQWATCVWRVCTLWDRFCTWMRPPSPSGSKESLSATFVALWVLRFPIKFLESVAPQPALFISYQVCYFYWLWHWVYISPSQLKIKSAPISGAAGVHGQPHPSRTAAPAMLGSRGEDSLPRQERHRFYCSYLKFGSFFFFLNK